MDLHIHSCLSPCGDELMTPNNIAKMAYLKGLDLIAVTDHNTARNLPAVEKACREIGMHLLPTTLISSASLPVSPGRSIRPEFAGMMEFRIPRSWISDVGIFIASLRFPNPFFRSKESQDALTPKGWTPAWSVIVPLQDRAAFRIVMARPVRWIAASPEISLNSTRSSNQNLRFTWKIRVSKRESEIQKEMLLDRETGRSIVSDESGIMMAAFHTSGC